MNVRAERSIRDLMDIKRITEYYEWLYTNKDEMKNSLKNVFYQNNTKWNNIWIALYLLEKFKSLKNLQHLSTTNSKAEWFHWLILSNS